MKQQEAESLVTMLAAATSKRLLPDEKIVWEEQLRPLDAEFATKAVLTGRNTWTHFPSWAQYREVYLMLKRRQEADARQAVVEIEGKLGVATPEWVWVWSWCRMHRDPREDRSFPQQGDYGDPFNTMSKEEYAALRQEWIDAGSPKRNPITGASERMVRT